MAGGQPAEDGAKTEVRGEIGLEAPQAERAAAVDSQRHSGEVRVRAPVRVDGCLVGEPDERLRVFGLLLGRAAEAYLSGRGAADGEAVPVEDERLA